MLPEPVVDGAAATTTPLLVGTNRDELYLFTALDGRMATVDDAKLRTVAQRLAGDAADSLIAAYAAARPGRGPGQLGTSIAGDDAFWLPAIGLAEDRRAPTWMYRFDWATPVFGGVLGACHGVELPFVFDTLDAARGFVGDDPSLADLAATVHRAWVRFATTGDPGWPTYDGGPPGDHGVRHGQRRRRRPGRRPARPMVGGERVEGWVASPAMPDYESLFRLDGRRALVVGAGSGIGAASAAGLAAFGAEVICADIQIDAAKSVAAELPGATALRLDIADTASIEAAADQLGPPAILVTTPSVNVRKRIVDYTDAELDRVVDLLLRRAMASVVGEDQALRRGDHVVGGVGRGRRAGLVVEPP